MSKKIVVLGVALALYAGMLWNDLSHPEELLSRRQEPPATGQAAVLPAARDSLELRPEFELEAAAGGTFSEPARDVFDYREAAPRPPAPQPIPMVVPPPAAPLPAPPRRIARESIVVHGLYEQRERGELRVFLSVNDELQVVRQGDPLPGGLTLKSAGRGGIVISTSDGQEEERFALP